MNCDHSNLESGKCHISHIYNFLNYLFKVCVMSMALDIKHQEQRHEA